MVRSLADRTFQLSHGRRRRFAPLARRRRVAKLAGRRLHARGPRVPARRPLRPLGRGVQRRVSAPILSLSGRVPPMFFLTFFLTYILTFG